ncbi:hypothetical protein SAMN05421512_11849, partial [Stappia indica]
ALLKPRRCRERPSPRGGRSRATIRSGGYWIPAFAGMTAESVAATRSLPRTVLSVRHPGQAKRDPGPESREPGEGALEHPNSRRATRLILSSRFRRSRRPGSSNPERFGSDPVVAARAPRRSRAAALAPPSAPADTGYLLVAGMTAESVAATRSSPTHRPLGSSSRASEARPGTGEPSASRRHSGTPPHSPPIPAEGAIRPRPTIVLRRRGHAAARLAVVVSLDCARRGVKPLLQPARKRVRRGNPGRHSAAIRGKPACQVRKTAQVAGMSREYRAASLPAVVFDVYYDCIKSMVV